MSLIGKINAAIEERARSVDPWRSRLAGLRGRADQDGVERIATQTVFDFLKVPQHSRKAGQGRRLAMLMREHGWSPIKARGLNQRGLLEQIRGYARDRTGSPLS